MENFADQPPAGGFYVDNNNNGQQPNARVYSTWNLFSFIQDEVVFILTQALFFAFGLYFFRRWLFKDYEVKR